jgi:hypothetical protein
MPHVRTGRVTNFKYELAMLIDNKRSKIPDETCTTTELTGPFDLIAYFGTRWIQKC